MKKSLNSRFYKFYFNVKALKCQLFINSVYFYIHLLLFCINYNYDNRKLSHRRHFFKLLVTLLLILHESKWSYCGLNGFSNSINVLYTNGTRILYVAL